MTIAAANVISSVSAASLPGFDLDRVRREFPILGTLANGYPLAYLDNGATTQKPRVVIEAERRFYEGGNANIHRGVYRLSVEATEAYEGAREKVRAFLNAGDVHEIIFTRGTTESINLVAASWGRGNLRRGDEVLISGLEHHSNIVPWQMACEVSGAELKVIPLNDRGEVVMEEFYKLLSPKTKMVAVAHLSNSLGTILPVEEIIAAAHRVGAKVLIDGAQWVSHFGTDVRKLDADFYVFSGHKLLGPTGIGVLYGKRAILEAMGPWQGGGDMIESVSFAKTTYAGLPNKFEAGTPNIAGAVGLGAAIGFVESIGLEKIAAWEGELLRYATEKLSAIEGVRIVGTAEKKASVLSFVMEKPAVGSLDIGQKLDAWGIAVRTGHHCCQPVMDRYGIASTTRASFAFYNTIEEVDRLVAGVKKIRDEYAVKEVARVAEGLKAAAASPSSGEYLSLDALPWPRQFAPSVSAAAEKIFKSFALFPDAKGKNEYLESLSEKIPKTLGQLRHMTTRVPGCMSEVFVVGRRSPVATDVVDLLADSDASTVRGLIAVMQRLFAGQKISEVLAFDLDGFFKRIELDSFLTNKRRIGLAGMIAKMRELAAENAGKAASGPAKVALPLVVKEDKAAKVIAEKIGKGAMGPAREVVVAGNDAALAADQVGLKKQIVAALKKIFDPEIPLNIYDLGLVYRIDISPENKVAIDMTLTAPGCPVAGDIVESVRKAVDGIAEVAAVEVNLVWEPQWTRDRLTEAARLQLGLV